MVGHTLLTPLETADSCPLGSADCPNLDVPSAGVPDDSETIRILSTVVVGVPKASDSSEADDKHENSAGGQSSENLEMPFSDIMMRVYCFRKGSRQLFTPVSDSIALACSDNFIRQGAGTMPANDFGCVYPDRAVSLETPDPLRCSNSSMRRYFFHRRMCTVYDHDHEKTSPLFNISWEILTDDCRIHGPYDTETMAAIYSRRQVRTSSAVRRSDLEHFWPIAGHFPCKQMIPFTWTPASAGVLRPHFKDMNKLTVWRERLCRWGCPHSLIPPADSPGLRLATA